MQYIEQESPNEMSDDFIREYLQGQLAYYSEPFIEKKTKSQIQSEEAEFYDLMSEITKDEQQIKVLIELCAFLLDKNQTLNQRYEDEARSYEEHIQQLMEKLEFESRTQKQFQKMYQEAQAKIKENVDVIVDLENQLMDKENSLMILQQSQRKKSYVPNKEEQDFMQNAKVIEELRSQIQKLKAEQKNVKEKVDYYQTSYSRQAIELEDSMNENAVLKQEQVRNLSKLRSLEIELVKINQTIQDQENTIENLNETILNLKKQIYEIQNTSSLKEPQSSSVMSSQIIPAQSIQGYANNNKDKLDIPENPKPIVVSEFQGFLSNRYSVPSKYQKGPCILEEPDEDGSNLHSKQTSVVPPQISGQIDVKKLEEKLQRLATPSQTPRQQTVITPRTQIPKVVQDNWDNKASRLKGKLIQSGVLSNSNLTSPRPNLQPITIRNDRDDDEIREEDEDFYYEQKVVTPQIKKQIVIPSLTLKKEENSASSAAQEKYVQFTKANEQLISEMKLESIQIKQKSLRQSMNFQNSTVGKSILLPKRDPYQEFFELLCQCVKLNSEYFQDIIYIDTSNYYNEIKKTGLPYHMWEQWIRDKLEEQVEDV